MAGLAPLGASPTTTQQVTGTGATVPGLVAPANPAPPPPSPKPPPPNFTAFPSSYAGFGADGSAYGTPGVVDGKLSIVAAPPQPPPPADPGAPAKGAGAASQTSAPPQVNDAAVTGNSTQTAPGSTAPTANGSQPQPTLQKTDATDQKVANESNTLGSVGNATQNSPAQNTGQTNTAGSAPAPPPGTGLLGGNGPPPIPGGTAVENNPALGLLGAPPTNPIVIQADKQEAEAAEATAEASDAAAAQQAAAQAQLQPTQTKLTGEIQGQTFAGVGSTPPQPFARPEIPTVFLNIAS
jgi:hypothetical protein